MTNNIEYPTGADRYVGREFVVGTTTKVWDGEKWGNKTIGNHELRLQELEAHEESTTNPHGVTKTQVGLSNVDNVSAANLRDRSTHTGTQSLSTISDAGSAASKDVGTANGVASLDGSGKVPDSESQVPSGVIKAQLIGQGLSGNYGFFEEGFTYSVEGDIGIDAAGNSWIYVGAGAPNKIVTAGTVPSAPEYDQVTFNAASGVILDDGSSVQDFRDATMLDVERWKQDGDLRGWGYVGDYFLSDGSKNPAPTDNNQAWLNAIAYMQSKGGGTITVPTGISGYVSTSSTIQIPKGVFVKQNSPQFCDNDVYNHTLWDYNGEGAQFGDFRFDIRPTKLKPSWMNTGEVGLTIRNCQEINCDVVCAWGFHTGLKLIGEDNKGVAHSTFNLGLFFDNKIDVSIYGTGTEGYVNQNTFNQGQFISSSGFNQLGNRIAVLMDHAGNYKHNNNVFYNPSFEKKSDPAQGNIAVVLKSARNNEFLSVRAEMKNRDAIWKLEGSSERNKLTVLYSNIGDVEIDSSTGANNVLLFSQDMAYDKDIIAISDFSRYVRQPSAGDSSTHNMEMWKSTGANPTFWDGGDIAKVVGGYLELKSGASAGVVVGTHKAKQLRIQADFKSGSGGRILCVAMDINKDVISNISGFKTINSQVIASEGSSFQGGGFTGGVNSETQDFRVLVPDNCKYLWVGVYAKGSVAKCNYFSTSSTEQADVSTVRGGSGFYSLSTPTATTYEQGASFLRLNRIASESVGWTYNGSIWIEG